MKLTRTWLLLGPGALLVAGRAASAQTRTAPGSGIKVSKEQPTATTSTSSTKVIRDTTTTTHVVLCTGETRRVADVTSRSLDAYKTYADGVDARYNNRLPDARRLLLRAVEIDPTFAMAHYELALSARQPLRAHPLEQPRAAPLVRRPAQ